MVSLWEQLQQYASARGKRLPTLKRDLWDLPEKMQALGTIVERLTKEFEEFRTSAQAEIDKLRLQVEVLQAHEARRRNG